MILAKGAEAVVEEREGKIIKTRPKKGYRLSVLDEQLRRSRTRREAKMLSRLQDIIPVPRLLSSDDRDMVLIMEYIKGPKLAEAFTVDRAAQAAKTLSLMHKQHVIHGDLTTSNMILRDDEIVFIDFGLSFVSDKTEDRAVDLHLLLEAIKSKHYRHYDAARPRILAAYQGAYPEADVVLTRLLKVEQRGRNKQG